MSREAHRQRRLQRLLELLQQQGRSQRQIALEVNLPPAYVSDLKHGHRRLSEPMARRLGELYGACFAWLWHGIGSPPTPAPPQPAAELAQGRLLLPVLPAPTRGEPRRAKSWDGSQVELAAAAKTRALAAVRPYVLRLEKDCLGGRLCRHDLVLMSQGASSDTPLAVAERDAQLVLIAREGAQGWRYVDSGRRVPRQPALAGECLGIVWARLREA